jgi:hypothetical protein
MEFSRLAGSFRLTFFLLLHKNTKTLPLITLIRKLPGSPNIAKKITGSECASLAMNLGCSAQFGLLAMFGVFWQFPGFQS